MTILTNILSGSILSNLVTDLIPSGDTLTVNALWIGDSNAFQEIEDDDGQAFIDECATYGITATVTEGARSGSYLMSASGTPYWWNTTTGDTTGGIYDTEVGGLANKADITDVFISLFVNDLLAGDIDKAQAKGAYQGLIDKLIEDLTGLQRIFISPLFRPVSGTAFDRWSIAREIEEELVAENANVYRGGEAYHLKMEVGGTGVHLIDSEEPVRQQIHATNVMGIVGQTTKQGLGMLVETAQVVDDGILLNITHKDGTDWTLPADSTNTVVPFALYNDTTRQGGISGDIMTKLSATQAKITCPAISDASVVVVDGIMAGMGGGDVDPNVAYDNSTLELPFGRSTPAITYEDPILGMTGMTDAIKSGFIKTFSSGVIIDEVKSLNDGVWIPDVAGSELTYDSSAFGAYGGFVSTNLDDQLETNVAFAAQFWQAGAAIVGATPSANIKLHQLGTNGTISSNNILWIESTNGNIIYDAREGSGNPITISTDDWRDKTLIYVLDAKGIDDWTLTIYDVEAGTITTIDFDPNNNYTTRNRMYFGGGDATFGDGYLRVGSSLGDETGDLTVAEVIAEIKDNHNL